MLAWVAVGDKYRIVNAHHGRALSTQHNSKTDPSYKGNGEAIILWEYYGDPTQLWSSPG